MAELQPIIVFHSCYFVRHLGICNPICVKLLQVMFGFITRNLKKNDVCISNRFPGIHKRGIHTHTHDNSIRRNAMCCISPKITNIWVSITHNFIPFALETGGSWNSEAIELTNDIGKRITAINSTRDTIPVSADFHRSPERQRPGVSEHIPKWQ